MGAWLACIDILIETANELVSKWPHQPSFVFACDDELVSIAFLRADRPGQVVWVGVVGAPMLGSMLDTVRGFILATAGQAVPT